MPTETEEKPTLDGSHDDLDLSQAERQAEIDSLNSLYNDEGTGDGDSSDSDDKSLYNEKADRQKARSFVKRNSKNLLGGGIAAGVISSLIASFFLIMPMKVINFANNMQDRFYASTDQASEDMSQALLRTYIVKYVMPGMVQKGCTSTLQNKDCVSVRPGDGPVMVLFNAWRDTKFEQKLAERGIVIERQGQGGKSVFKLITPSTAARNGIDLGEFNSNDLADMNRRLGTVMERGDVRREVKQAFSDETFYKQMFYRYKVGRFMERKYGVVRCVIACNVRDNARATIDEKKLVYKKAFIDRVIAPRSQLYAEAMKCALDGFRCKEARSSNEYGERETEFEATARTAVTSRDSRNTTLNDEEVQRLADDIQNKGITNIMIEKIDGEILKFLVGKSIAAIPWVGVVYVALEVLNAAQAAGPAVMHINYVINSQAMVTQYMSYRTTADEMVDGKANSAMLGSVTSSLGENAGTDQNGGPLESAPVYGEYFGTNQKTNTVLSPFKSKVYAASNYPCNNGGSVDTSICDELKLNAAPGAAMAVKGASDVFNTPPFDSIGQVGSVILNTLNTIIGIVTSFITTLLPDEVLAKLTDFMKFIGQQVASLFGPWFAKYFVNDAVGTSPSGARNGELAIGGANVSGNATAHYVTGGKRLTNKQVADIRSVRETEEYESFKEQSYFARIFDTDSKYSFVNQVAFAIPSGSLDSVGSSLLARIANPFNTLASIMPTYGSSVEAAPGDSTVDEWGVSQYGYPQDDPVFSEFSDEMWDKQNCSDPEAIKRWGDSATINPLTGVAEHDQTFSCNLIETVATASCGIMSDTCLSPEELGTSAENTGAGVSLTAVSYNLPNKAGYGPAQWVKAVNNINDKNFDVIGFQELQGGPNSNYAYLKENLKNHDVYPSWSHPARHCASGQAIFYNKTLFTFIKGEWVEYPRYTDGATDCGNGEKTKQGFSHAPIVWLQTDDGQVVVVMNAHNAANGFGGVGANGANIRARAGDIFIEKIKEIRAQDPNVPIILTGDFNEGTGVRTSANTTLDGNYKNLMFCKFAENGLMFSAEGQTMKCPGNGIGGVDYIYLTKGITVNSFDTLSPAQSGSDHPKVPFARITIGGGSSNEAGDVGSVKMGDDYKGCSTQFGVCGGQCVDFVKFRLLKNGTKYKGGPLGNGHQVANYLGSAYGYKVDNEPAVNAVVSWPPGGVPGSGANSAYGHVAMVSAVKADGSIIIEEYNYATPLKYSVRTIPAEAAKKLTYAHTEVDF